MSHPLTPSQSAKSAPPPADNPALPLSSPDYSESTPESRPNSAYTREPQFGALFEGALDAVLIADDQRRYVDANRAACTLFGLSLAEIKGMRVEDFAPPGAHHSVEQSWQQFIQCGEQRGEMCLCLCDGSTRDVEYSAKANFIPGYHLSILRDFTQRKEIETRLRENEAQFRSLVEAIPQQIWTAGPDGALDYVSPRVVEYSGQSFETLIGQGWQHILHPDDVPECLARWTHALRTGQPYEIEFRLKRASDESYRWHLGRALPVLDAQGQITKWFGTNTDITERKELEEERAQLLAQEQAARVQAEAANKAKDEFLAFLSHEMRTPLTAILGWTRLLREGQLDPVLVTQAVDSIERSAQVQARLMEDMLDASRIILGRLRLEKELVELAPVIETAIAIVRPTAKTKGVQLDAHLDCDGQMVWGDSYRLQQVVWNLLSNAIKFTPTAGKVKVHMKQVGSLMEIKVSDNGQGISAQFLPRVFERLEQEEGSWAGNQQEGDSEQSSSVNSRSVRRHQNSGLGLGLSIVRSLVEAHDGTVHAASEGKGKGATFTVCLPLVSGTAGDTLSETESAV